MPGTRLTTAPRSHPQSGHLAAKHNSSDDFVAAADHLTTLGLTSPDRLVAQGGSAGGLLMEAVANRGPDRFSGLLAEVPFVDSLTTMLNPTLPLTVGEYEKWGDPTDDPEAFATIASWAPYENLRALDDDGTPFTYPPLLLTGGLNDTRVGFWEPAKLVARLRHLNPENPVLLRMEMDVGHGGPSGRYASWREEAYVSAWILERLGLSRVEIPRAEQRDRVACESASFQRWARSAWLSTVRTLLESAFQGIAPLLMHITTFSIWWDGLGGSPSVIDRIEILTEFAEVTVVTTGNGASQDATARPYGEAASLTMTIPTSIVARRPGALRTWRRFLGFSPAYPARLAIRRCGTPLRRIIRDSDLLEIHSASLTDLVLIPELRRLNRSAPVVVFCHDILSDPNGVWIGLGGNGATLLIQRCRVAFQRHRERTLLNKAQLITVHHDRDRRLLEEIGVTTPIEVVFPTISSPHVALRAPDERVLFVGNLSRAVNESAVRWFLDNCWEQIREARPTARLAIAGIGAPKIAFDPETPGLEMVGPFDDLDALHATARVVIAPLLRGAGIKYKVLESMVRAIPVVATTVAAAGIVETIGEEPFARITDDPNAFAERVIDLLANPDEARRIGDSGRQALIGRVDRDTTKSLVRDLYRATMQAHQSA